MRILHFNDHINPQGGVEQYLFSVCRLLDEAGHENVIAYVHDYAAAVDAACPIYQVCTVGDMQQLIDAVQPDVAYLHHATDAALITTLSVRLPTIGYVHGFAPVCPGLGKFFRRTETICTRPFSWACAPLHYVCRCSAARHPLTLRRIMRETALRREAFARLPHLLVASDYMRDLLRQNGFDPEKISILPPHFLTPPLPPWQPPTEPHTILFAGRLEVEKGVPKLLRALRALPSHIRLIMAGEGTQRSLYEQMVAEMGLAARVQFTGWLSAVSLAELYQRCALLVISSQFAEPFGKVGIEALAHGRPVVAFATGGIAGWLHDGHNGRLVTPGDEAGLAQAIGQLLSQPAVLQEMGQTSQAQVWAGYRAETHLQKLLALMRQLPAPTQTTD